jgi:hypothetical protein
MTDATTDHGMLRQQLDQALAARDAIARDLLAASAAEERARRERDDARSGRAIPLPEDFVEAPTLRRHADGRVEIDWVHGRGATWISADLLEEAVDAINYRVDES